MDELDLLKKDWKKREAQLPKLSYDDIYKMIWKKSSSIVKWIFLISIIEFVLPHLLYLIPSWQEGMEVYKSLGLQNFLIGISVLQYTVVFYFIYQFYRRYKEISVLDNAKDLMSKIIKTRKTVKHYVIFSLSLILCIVVMLVIGIYLNDNLITAFDFPEKAKNISPEKFKVSMMWAVGIFGVAFTLFMGAVYFLLYGLLLRRLKKNYKELKRLEV